MTASAAPPFMERTRSGMVYGNDSRGEYWTRVEAMVLTSALHVGLDVNDAEDCARDFTTQRASRGYAAPDQGNGADSLSPLRAAAWWHVRRWKFRWSQSHVDCVYLAELSASMQSGGVKEPVSPSPGPEELAIRAAMRESVLLIVDSLPERRRRLWYRVVIDGVRIADVSAETGRSANALYIEMGRIRDVIRAALAAEEVY